MKTSETIDLVCSDLGITKANLAKRMEVMKAKSGMKRCAVQYDPGKREGG